MAKESPKQRTSVLYRAVGVIWFSGSNTFGFHRQAKKKILHTHTHTQKGINIVLPTFILQNETVNIITILSKKGYFNIPKVGKICSENKDRSCF